MKRPIGAVSQNAAVARRTDAGGRVQRSRGRPGFHHPCTPAARLSSRRMKCQRARGGSGRGVGGGGAKSAGGINRYAAGKLCFSRASFQFSGPGRRDGKASLPLSAPPSQRRRPLPPPQVLTAAAATATRRQTPLIKWSERISSEVKTAFLSALRPAAFALQRAAAETDATIKKTKGRLTSSVIFRK